MFQVMRFTVQEINNSSLILPNVSLGYEILNHCSDVFNFQAILKLINSISEEHQRVSVRVNIPNSCEPHLVTKTIHLIVLIIQHFNWDWVAFISSSDEYKELNEKSDHYEILQNLESLSIEVIIVCTMQRSAIAFMK
ncbi:unnamed protein product [Coregonus sp. 'balchen']|nr:unnamed protein product [Coregonus sp. 'balchen']